MSYKIIALVLTSLCLGCQSTKTRSKKSGADPDLPSPSPPAEQCTTDTLAQPRLIGPYILVHGGLGPQLTVEMDDFHKWLEGIGADAKDIHEPNYPYLLSAEKIGESLAEKFGEIFDRYADDTKFTFITHSLGQFAALYTILENDLSSRVGQIISLGGFINGQDKKPKGCVGDLCGLIWDSITPRGSPFTRDLLAKHENTIRSIPICNIYSSDDDKITDPLEASKVTKATDVKVEGYKHKDLIQNPEILDVIRAQCFEQITCE